MYLVFMKSKTSLCHCEYNPSIRLACPSCLYKMTHIEVISLFFNESEYLLAEFMLIIMAIASLNGMCYKYTNRLAPNTLLHCSQGNSSFVFFGFLPRSKWFGVDWSLWKLRTWRSRLLLRTKHFVQCIQWKPSLLAIIDRN